MDENFLEDNDLINSAKKKKVLFVLCVDTSTSMQNKMHVVNNAIDQTIDTMKKLDLSHNIAKVEIAIMELNREIKWIPAKPQEISNFHFQEIQCSLHAQSNYTSVYQELNEKLQEDQFLKEAHDYHPIILLISDSQPTDDYKTDEGLISIKLNEKETIYKAPEKYSDGTVLEKFEGGKTFTINLSAAISDSYWANKKVWVYGINPPEEGAWEQFYTNYSTYYLPLKEEYGLYDVNKRNPSDNYEGVPDGMMCWAASASNLIHWWTYMNKEYIDRYIELGKYKVPDCKYDFEKAQTQEDQESQIFQTFIDSFEDQAGNIDDGVNWFIHGIKPVLPAMGPSASSGGYFKDVFPDGVKLATNIGGMGKETFNKVIKDALLNNKAIGFNSGTVKNSHAMTILGAEFDETGNVSYIYFVDNNITVH